MVGRAGWKPADWSMLGVEMRTNNDLEGYHHKLDRNLMYNKPNMYLLINILYHDRQATNDNIQLVKPKEQYGKDLSPQRADRQN